MRIGIGVGSFGGGSGNLASLVNQARHAESDGLQAVWVTHIRGVDSLIAVALASQATKRIEFVTGVIPVYSREPLLMAQQALTTHEASGGRLALGLGLAHRETVERMWNHTFEHPAHFMDEYLSALMPLLLEKTVAFKGDVIATQSELDLDEVGAPSVMLAALAPRMLKMAGARTDGTVLWMTGPKTIHTHIAPRINDAASAAGRRAPRIVAALPICVTDDVHKAREAVERQFGRYGQLENYRRVLDIEGATGPQDVAIAGNEEEVEMALRELADAGATDFFAAMVRTGRNDDESIQRTRALLTKLIGKI